MQIINGCGGMSEKIFVECGWAGHPAHYITICSESALYIKAALKFNRENVFRI